MGNFGDFGVTLGYILTGLSMVACIVYGILNWNKPREDQEQEIREEVEWENNDPDLSEGDL